jgi:hypothetical protein
MVLLTRGGFANHHPRRSVWDKRDPHDLPMSGQSMKLSRNMQSSFKNIAAIVGLGFLLYGLQLFSPESLRSVLYWSLPLFNLVFHPYQGGNPNAWACLGVLVGNAMLVSVMVFLLASRPWRQERGGEKTSSVSSCGTGKGGLAWCMLKTAGRVVKIQLLGFLGLLMVPFVGGCILLTSPMDNANFFIRSRYEAIVEEVRQAGLKPEEQREFALDDLSVPKSLRPCKLDQEGRCVGLMLVGHVWAEKSAGGELKVVILTLNMGHMGGLYGFAYSDVPLTPVADKDWDGCFWLELPRMRMTRLNWQIDKHWWKVQVPD